MGSFLSLLQKTDVARRRWDTREDLRLAIVTRIGWTHHRRRAPPPGKARAAAPDELESIRQTAHSP